MDDDTLQVLLNAVLDSSSSSSSSSEDSDFSGDNEQVVQDPIPCDKEPAPKKKCLKNFFEEEVLTYSPKEFLKHFHITKELFDSLCEQFAASPEFSTKRMLRAASAPKHVAVFLWYVSHVSCAYRDLGERFSLTVFSIESVIRRVCKFLSTLADEIIQWPDEFQKDVISDSFEEICGFPGVIGAIGTFHIPVDPPKASKEDYLDKYGDHSLIFQGVCDDSKKFLDMRYGLPGGRSASQVFHESETIVDLETCCEDYFVVGNSSYPCLKNLLTPYRNTEALTDAQQCYNERIKSGCDVIESAFELVKRRFPQILTCKIKELDKINQLVKACCVLHNLSELADLCGIAVEEVFIRYSRIAEANPENGDTAEGISIRNEVCQHLNRSQN